MHSQIEAQDIRKSQSVANEQFSQAHVDMHSSVLQRKSQALTLQRKENKTGLPDHLKMGIEKLSGMSMDDVRVHRNSDKPAQLQAHAYAQGTQIHLGPGKERHLPHEAWHVVQQKQGRVKPTMQMGDNININGDKGLETEADIMGAKAFQLKSKISLHSPGCTCSSCSGEHGETIQPKLINAKVVQLCTHCGDPSCVKGEKCRKPPEGLFPAGSGSWGTKFYNQRRGHDGKPTEWEHPVPGKAYRDAGMGAEYRSAPVLQIPKTMHRGGVSGVGGGISSTGSSDSAKIWSGGIGKTLASGDFGEAIWRGVADGMNSALHTDQDLSMAADGYYRIIQMHFERGDIDDATRKALLEKLMDMFMKIQDHPAYFGKPGGSGGGGGGPSAGGGGAAITA